MSFRVNVNLEGVEFRKLREGDSIKDDGTKSHWMSIRVEDYDGNNVEISVRNEGLRGYCREMRKGLFYNLPVTCVATNAYNFIALAGEPEQVPDPEEV